MRVRIILILLFSILCFEARAQSKAKSIPFNSLPIQYTKVDSLFEHEFYCLGAGMSKAYMVQKYQKQSFGCSDQKSSNFVWMLSTFFETGHIEGVSLSGYLMLYFVEPEAAKELYKIYSLNKNKVDWEMIMRYKQLKKDENRIGNEFVRTYDIVADTSSVDVEVKSIYLGLEKLRIKDAVYPNN